MRTNLWLISQMGPIGSLNNLAVGSINGKKSVALVNMVEYKKSKYTVSVTKA